MTQVVAAAATRCLPPVRVRRCGRRRDAPRRPRRRVPRALRGVGVRGRARGDVRRERALPPLSVAEPRRRGLRARRLDHAMIFVFIAGTYTAFALVAFDGTARVVGSRHRLGRRCARNRPEPRLDRCAALAHRGRLPRRRLGRAHPDPAALSGARRRCGGAGDRRRRPLQRRCARLRDDVAEPVPGHASASTRSSICSWSRPRRRSSSRLSLVVL